jgi:hypothetical protein
LALFGDSRRIFTDCDLSGRREKVGVIVGVEGGGVEIVFPGDADQGEKRVAPRIVSAAPIRRGEAVPLTGTPAIPTMAG